MVQVVEQLVQIAPSFVVFHRLCFGIMLEVGREERLRESSENPRNCETGPGEVINVAARALLVLTLLRYDRSTTTDRR